jgi:hypothetical protein
MSIENMEFPVAKGDTVEWTEKQRSVADNAEEIKSVEELLARVSVRHIHLDIYNTNHADEYHGACQKRPVHQNFHRYLERVSLCCMSLYTEANITTAKACICRIMRVDQHVSCYLTCGRLFHNSPTTFLY